MNIFSRIKAIICLNEAIRMANDEFIKQGTRFYVVPYNTDDYKPKLLVMDRSRFRQFKIYTATSHCSQFRTRGILFHALR